MGAWGPGLYDNDDALDFLDDCGREGAVAIARAFVKALGADYLEAPDASAAIAAAGLVAEAHDGRGTATTRDIVLRLRADIVKDRSAIATAIAVLDRVVAEKSELRDLMKAGNEPDTWRPEIAALRARLDAIRKTR